MQSRNNKNNSITQKITTSVPYQVATQVGLWIVNHPAEIFASTIGLCCAYKLVVGKFNGDEQPLNQLTSEAQLYSWFSSSTHFSNNILASYANIITHGFPITKSMFKQIGLGIAIGVLQYPMYCSMFTEYKVSPNKTMLGYATSYASEDKNSRFDAHFLAPIDEECLFRGLVIPVFWAYLIKLGIPSAYAITGTVIINSAVFARVHHSGNQLPAFVFGLFQSGFTLGQDGSLWTSVAAHATHNMLITATKKYCMQNDTPKPSLKI